MASNTIIQSTSSSSHAIKTYEYDVFVSFRGEDTRNNFTGFLFEALRRNAMEAFKDNEDLKKGESIAPELLQAIQGSRIFVVVFSKNYASSTWCLRELVEICNCIETSPRQVLPIFYDVDPSEVRKQSRCYEQAFSKHEETFREDKEKMEEVVRWRKTLSKVADFSGWDIGNKPQHAEIEQIAQEIKIKLGPKFSSLPKDNLVGIESRVKDLEELLRPESLNDVLVVGISGMSGIGKTTLARALYERSSHQFHFHCFIDDVSRIYQHSSTLGVQKQLLSQCLNEKYLEICNVSEATSLVWTRLRNAKGLIVLDNVDQFEQLKMFSGNRENLLRECLGGGSRIIISSRNEQILRTYKVDDIYQVQSLNREDAVQLFCINAFKSNFNVSDYYKELTLDVLSLVDGHPLAIEVIGKSLFGKSDSCWRSALTRLRKNMNKDIMAMLRIGYEELDDEDQKIFLDIACFFDFQKEQYVKEILDIQGFDSEYGLQVLVDKSLITIKQGMIFMHEMLKILGRYIVRENSPKEPRKWSRLWDYQDLHKVMSDNMEEANIEAIIVDRIPMEFCDTILAIDALSKMRNLKLLILPDMIKSSGSLNDLSNELGYINWVNFPFDCLPQSFEPGKLVKLFLCESNIKQLWESTKPLHKLRHLDLSDSEKLIKVQNFGNAINLQSLNLQGCIQLKEIDPSSSFPKNLTTLNLKDCKSLINLPHFREALNLEILNLEGCTQLRQIDPSIGHLSKLTILNLKDCINLVSLPNSIWKLNSIEFLSLSGCSKLYNSHLLKEPRDTEYVKKLHIGEAPGDSQSMSYIKSFSREQKDSVSWLLPSLPILSCIRQLDLSFCNLLHIPDAIGSLHSLERLCLKGNNFASLPNLSKLSKLLHLNLQHCKRLGNLPELPSQTEVPSPNYCPPKPILDADKLQQFDEHGSGLNIFNCPELAKRERCSNMCFAWMMRIVKTHHQYHPCELGGWLWPPKFSSIIPGSEIPSWFNNPHEEKGNSIRIYRSTIYDNNNWIGVACNAIFRVVHNERTMKREYSKYHDRIPLLFRGNLVTDESDHMWLFYFTRSSFIELCTFPASFDLRFELNIMGGKGYDVEVKKYGYRFVSEQDLQSLNLTMMHSKNLLPQKHKFVAIEENK